MLSLPPSLLDLPPYPADGYAKLADRLAALLRTRNDVLLVQSEAIVALEAVATSVGSKNIRALNVVTSTYGRWFGEWLRRAGASVTDLAATPPLPITIEAFAAGFNADPGTNLVSMVHAESASGILNPLPEIAALVRRRGALLVVDGVASFGGHPFDVDALDIDIAVIGPQKSLGGYSGVSAVSISPRAWQQIDRPDAPGLSTLSLMDLKRTWLDTGRRALPGMPSALEFHALEAALDRIDAEGIDATVARHALAAAATRAGVAALGLETLVDAPFASNLVTAVRLPDAIPLDAFLAKATHLDETFSAGVGEGATQLLRLNHTGQRANPVTVHGMLDTLASVLRDFGHHADIDAALMAARGASPLVGEVGLPREPGG